MIVNLTQHTATKEQVLAGVVDLPAPYRAQLIELLTVEQLPTRAEIAARCADIAALAAMSFDCHPGQAMVGCAPWMVCELAGALVDAGIAPMYAFSARESVEVTDPDGSVRKTTVFRHVGFVS